MTEQDFKDIVLVSLTKIESALDQNEKDHKEIKNMIVKIPAMEIGLNNHLRSHDAIKRYVFYPVLVAIIIAFVGLFGKLILKVF